MRRVLLAGALWASSAACIDQRDGLACTADPECFGYVCNQGLCVDPDALAAPADQDGDPTLNQERDAGPHGHGGRDAGDDPTTSPPDGGSTVIGPTVIAAGQPGPMYLRADSDDLYWVNGWETDPRKLMRVPKAGGESKTLATLPGQGSLALDGTWVYSSSTTALVRVPKAGGDVEVLATPRIQFGQSVAVEGGNVYWVDRTDGIPDKRIVKMPKGGGGIETVVGVEDAAIGGAADGYVFWRSPDGIGVLNTGSGNIFEVAATISSNIVTDGSFLYWIRSSSNLEAVALDGLTRRASVPMSRKLHRIAVEGGFIYGIGDGLSGGRVIVRMPVAGGPMVELASVGGEDSGNLSQPGGLIADQQFVFWSTWSGSASIRRLAR